MAESFVVAGDIGARLASLRAALGLTQEAFAALFGRGWKQVSAWENGRARPPKVVLERACRTHGWPCGIFTEGGPWPAVGVNRPVNAAHLPERASTKAQRQIVAEAEARLLNGNRRQLSAEEVLGWLYRMLRAGEELTPPAPSPGPGAPADE